MLPVFNPSGWMSEPREPGSAAFTFICSEGDPHPTDAGYQAMAEAVMRASL